LVSMGFYMVMPLLAKYAIQHGASVPAAGVIVGMFSITALFVRPAAGIISDRFNKKTVFIAATATIGLSLTGYGLSPGIAPLVVFRLIHAVAFSVNSTVSLALAAQIVPKKRTGEGIGYFGIGHIIATAVGPAVGQYIGESFGLSATFLIAGAATLAASAMIFALPVNGQKAPDPGEKQEKGIVGETDKRIRIADLIAVQVLPLAFFGSVFSMFNGTVGSYLVLLGEERGIADISLYFTINAAALILVRFTAGRVYDRYGLSAVLIPSFILAAAAAAFIGFAQALPIILAAAVIKAFAQGSAQPSIQAECIRMLPNGRSGVATSTYYIGADIGQGLGPMLAGAIATAWGYEVMFASCSVVFLAALLLYCARLFVQNRTSQECIAEQPGTAGETPSD
ncbi:MAG TPA: MFS transporter, partial [Clostridia bacterium]